MWNDVFHSRLFEQHEAREQRSDQTSRYNVNRQRLQSRNEILEKLLLLMFVFQWQLTQESQDIQKIHSTNKNNAVVSRS